MKRELCDKHYHHAKLKSANIIKDNPKCSICRWENRPWTLKDFATEFRNIADSLEICHDNPYYDPFGITFSKDIEDTVINFLNSIHPDYRKIMLDKINKSVAP